MNITLNTFERNTGPLTNKQIDQNWLNIEKELHLLKKQFTLLKVQSIEIKSDDWKYDIKDDFFQLHYKEQIVHKVKTEYIDSAAKCKLKITNSSEFEESKSEYLENDFVVIMDTKSVYYRRQGKWITEPFMNYVDTQVVEKSIQEQKGPNWD